MNIRKYFEDTLTTFRAVIQAFDEGTEFHVFNERVVQILSDEKLSKAFLRSALANVTDALLCRFEGTVCYLFERNWIDAVHAQHQLRKAGIGPLEAVRILGRCPIPEATMDMEDKRIVLAMMDGLLFPDHAIHGRTESKPETPDGIPIAADRPRKSRSSDLNVSEVAEILAVRRGTVLAHIRAGRLRAYNAALPGKKENWRITPLALDEFRAGDPPRQKQDSKRSGAPRPTHIEEFF